MSKPAVQEFIKKRASKTRRSRDISTSDPSIISNKLLMIRGENGTVIHPSNNKYTQKYTQTYTQKYTETYTQKYTQ